MVVDINFEDRGDLDYSLFIDELQSLDISGKVAIVTNPKVSGLHLKTLLEKLTVDELYIITIPDGEFYKNQESIDLVLENLFNHKFNRSSTLIAFGGGVIGDMTGFTASLYQRGIDFIQIPTTLLSQVDASVGGKTGVNNKYGKNLIGAFYQPKAVYIDPEFLKTLPPREFAAGVAEIVKMAVMFDKEYFEFLQNANMQNEEILKEAIRRSVELKAWVVNQDEKEAGIRAVLTYGHTFGHVVENETNYTTYLHGEAVAIGMVMANALAIELELFTTEEADKVKNLLKKSALPVDYVIKDVDDFYEHFFLDKKSANNSIKFILPNGMGDYKVVKDIDEVVVKKVLRQFGESR
jgi:3-dehydroquinate synthase